MMQGGVVVAGQLFAYRDGQVVWWMLGVRGGSLDLVKNGVLAAVYHFGIPYLQGQGYRFQQLGGVRPFLSDGVFQFKRKFGAMVTRAHFDSPRWFAAFFGHPARALHGFLAKNPFIVEDEHGLCGAALGENQRSANAASATEQLRSEFTAIRIARSIDINLDAPVASPWCSLLPDLQAGGSK